MSPHEHDQTVYQVAAQTLEALALMFLLPEEEAPAAPRPCARRAAVSFHGPFGGTLVLSASAGILPELAANMLGVQGAGATTPDQQEDALKELANVLCGNLLPAIAGDTDIFRISAPWAQDGGPDDRRPGGLVAGAVRLHTDVGTVEVALFVEERAPALA